MNEVQMTLEHICMSCYYHNSVWHVDIVRSFVDQRKREGKRNAEQSKEEKRQARQRMKAIDCNCSY
jgi:hypothetical protein